MAYANVNSTFYFLNSPFDFNLRGGLLYQSLKFRLGSSDFMLGGRFSYLNAEGEFKLDDVPVDYDGGMSPTAASPWKRSGTSGTTP